MKNDVLATTLRELRIAHGYKQEDVASALGVVRQTYSHYETGKRTPDSSTLYKLAGFYNISVEDLMHLTIEIDRNIYYDAPTPSASSQELHDYLDYCNNPLNHKKLQNLDNYEKELLYYFDKLMETDKKEMIEFTKIKARKQK